MTRLPTSTVAPERPDFRATLFASKPAKGAFPLLYCSTAVFTDPHYGARTFWKREQALCDSLRSLRPESRHSPLIVIIDGDLLESPKFVEDFIGSDTEKALRDLTVILIPGNHDKLALFFPWTEEDWNRSVRHLRCLERDCGIRLVRDRFEFEWQGKRVLVLHGDQFDRYVTHRPLLATPAYRAASALAAFAERFGDWGRDVSERAKKVVRQRSKWYRAVTQEASALAIRKGFDMAVVGHNHNTQELVSENPSFVLINTSTFKAAPSSFSTFGDTASVHLVP